LFRGVLAPPGTHVLLLGNEAIARGAIEAGIGFAAAYPGTPSTEIIETLGRVAGKLGIYVEWSTNEKVAFEAAYGAAISNVRSLVAMKHVGLNVAADPLMSSAYTGVRVGFVIVSADDPSMWSSQNEQDNRYYGLHAFIPVFEAYNPAEAKEVVKFAFDFSEKHKHPVIFRSTTRLSHSRGPVTLGEIPKIKSKGEYIKDAGEFTLIPQVSRKLRVKLLEKWSKIREDVNNVPFNRIEDYGSKNLIIASGMAYGYVKDALKSLKLNDQINILKIATPVPIPEKIVLKALENIEKVLIVEEIEPIVENEVKRIAFENNLNLEIHGKDYVPKRGELTIDNVANAILKFMKKENLSLPWKPLEITRKIEIPRRPPTLCPGCPHRAMFYALKKAVSKKKINPIYCGDIGCYSLGALPPFKAQDCLIEMGGSIGLANGLAHTTNQTPIAIMGDSTFFHACIPGLINAIYNDAPTLVLVLDNRTTAMTGHQPHPGTGIKVTGEKTAIIYPEKIAEGIGIKHVDVIDPYNLNESIDKIEKAIDYVVNQRKIAAIIVRRACALLISAMARRRELRSPKYQVMTEECKACGICYNLFGCPAITPKPDGKAEIIQEQCIGCSVCAQLCPFNAIKMIEKGSKGWDELWF